MKLSDFTNSLSPLEMSTLALFVIYIIFPFRTPLFLSGVINTPLGLIGVLIVTLYLFFYTNPLLGVVYIFVAYELLRRSSLAAGIPSDNYMIQYTPTEIKRAQEMVDMNPRRGLTLEEDIVATMAPAQKFNLDPAIDNGFQPVKEVVTGASVYTR
jgi:hypothetical protein